MASRDPRLSVAGPAGKLEALVAEPSGAAPAGVAVICHPHPLHGGTMDNKVVHTVARALGSAGLATVRFNFRGVGASAGHYADGVGETADALAVVAWARSRWPGMPLTLGGFSFGAVVAFRAARETTAAELITIAPAIAHVAAGADRPPAPRWLLVIGGSDEIVDPTAVRDWAATFAPPPTLAVLPGVGHFFHGALPTLAGTITAWKKNGPG